MNRRIWHDYDDGFDEATLWHDEDSDLESDMELGDPLDLYDQLDFEVMEKRPSLRAASKRPRTSGADKWAGKRGSERKRERAKTWGSPY